MHFSRRMITPLLFGIVGAAILCGLGIWQLQRLDWKRNILAQIEQRLAAESIALPENVDPTRDKYRAVETSGILVGPELHVLTSIKREGPGFRVIRAFDTNDGRRIMIDLGFIPETDKSTAREQQSLAIDGHLIWPDETDGFTPEPNLERNIWFARDVATMSEALGTLPIMIGVRSTSPLRPERPLPVTTNVANDHKEYAITWFSLMAIWIGMTGYLLYRVGKTKSKSEI